MGPILVLSILLQIVFAVHAVRTGRPMYWVFILIIGSYLGVLVYLVAEVIPELMNSRGARKASGALRDRIDPGRGKRQAARQFERADTQSSRRALAEQCLRDGEHARALELYRSCLKGIYADDPQLLLGLAQAQFGNGQPQDARRTIEALIAANPEFHSYEGHLLYARAIAAGGDVDAALEEYRALVESFPGEEARVRYAQLLRQAGRHEEATALFAETLRRAELAPKFYRQEQKAWIELARRELG